MHCLVVMRPPWLFEQPDIAIGSANRDNPTIAEPHFVMVLLNNPLAVDDVTAMDLDKAIGREKLAQILQRCPRQHAAPVADDIHEIALRFEAGNLPKPEPPQRPIDLEDKVGRALLSDHWPLGHAAAALPPGRLESL